MEKDTKKTVFVLQDNENSGTVQIANDVVAMVAAIAAMEIDGVSAMAGNITNELMSKVGVKKLTKGVRVEVIGKKVVVDVAVTMKYGYNIPATCQKVQQKVKNAIENMTGLTVEYVNVRIVTIQMQNK